MQDNNVDRMIQNNLLAHASNVEKDLLSTMEEPIDLGYIDDGLGAIGPLVLIGFLDKEPVCRTTHTVAHREHTFFKN
jgi:hypothetical protein